MFRSPTSPLPARSRPGRRAFPIPARVVTTLVAASALAAPSSALAGPLPAAPAPASPSSAPGADAALAWYDTTVHALGVAGWGSTGSTQVTASRTWATAWTAAEDAIAAVDAAGGHDAERRVALATAVHDVLVAYVPGDRATIDAQLAASLGEAPQGPSEARAAAAGRAAAATWLAKRAGDGLDTASVNAPFTPPAPAPRVWRPTGPAFAPAVQAGQGKGRPFILPSVAKTFVAPVPPAIDSPVVIRNLQEIDRDGSRDSTTRTPAQTATATFWSQASVSVFTGILRTVVADDHRGLADQVRLVSVFHRVTTDAQIAVYASKYRYLRWRPITALTTDDGNPRTPYDPSFVPFITTPAHPEYPSGHVGYAASAEQVLRALVGPRPVAPIVAKSAAAPGQTVTYRSWSQITQDNVDARVWDGIHLRSTDEITRRFGARIGVAALVAERLQSR